MKSTGIVRKIDELGRIVIPKELRDVLNIRIKDSLEIIVEENRILINKFDKSCKICSSASELVEYKKKMICEDCIKIIRLF